MAVPTEPLEIGLLVAQVGVGAAFFNVVYIRSGAVAVSTNGVGVILDEHSASLLP